MIDLEQHKIYLEDQNMYVLPYDIVQQHVAQLQVKALDEMQNVLAMLDESLAEISDDFDKLTALLNDQSDKL